jgi:hypothetical protein
MMDIITNNAQTAAFTGTMIVLWFSSMAIDVFSATLNRNSTEPDNLLSGVHIASLITHIAAAIALFQVYGAQATAFLCFSGAAGVYATVLGVVNAVKAARPGGSTTYLVVEKQL